MKKNGTGCATEKKLAQNPERRPRRFAINRASTEDFPRQFRVETVLLWVHAAKKGCKWYRRGLEAAERFMTRWHVHTGAQRELGAPRSPDAWRPKPKGGGGEGETTVG